MAIQLYRRQRPRICIDGQALQREAEFVVEQADGMQAIGQRCIERIEECCGIIAMPEHNVALPAVAEA